ncbi:hypothetical protein ACFL3Q_11025 [Planctomycetota bacterium]
MDLDDKSKRIKDELEKLREEYNYKLESPNENISKYIPERQYFISQTAPNDTFENISVNVSEEQISVGTDPKETRDSHLLITGGSTQKWVTVPNKLNKLLNTNKKICYDYFEWFGEFPARRDRKSYLL